MTWRIVSIVAAFTLIPMALFVAIGLYYASKVIDEIEDIFRK